MSRLYYSSPLPNWKVHRRKQRLAVHFSEFIQIFEKIKIFKFVNVQLRTLNSRVLTSSTSMKIGFTMSWLMSSKFWWPTQCSTFLFLPVKKLSTAMTSWPSSRRWSTRWDPTKPAPPVTWGKLLHL